MSRELAEIAPRLARAVAQERSHAMRGIKRCSCGEGYRIIGHEYDHGCIERLEWAKVIRDRTSEYREFGGSE